MKVLKAAHKVKKGLFQWTRGHKSGVNEPVEPDFKLAQDFLTLAIMFTLFWKIGKNEGSRMSTRSNIDFGGNLGDKLIQSPLTCGLGQNETFCPQQLRILKNEGSWLFTRSNMSYVGLQGGITMMTMVGLGQFLTHPRFQACTSSLQVSWRYEQKWRSYTIHNYKSVRTLYHGNYSSSLCA